MINIFCTFLPTITLPFCQFFTLINWLLQGVYSVQYKLYIFYLKITISQERLVYSSTLKGRQKQWQYFLLNIQSSAYFSFFLLFSFFLEKSMLMYFLKMMSQKSNQICVQLLQTLSILFENIRNETSLCECTVL